MNYKLLYTVLIISTVLYIAGCSELADDITPPASLTIHKPGILNPDSPDYHAKLIKEKNWDLKLCQQCHGGDFAGGTVNKSCLNCHTEENGPLACNTCHGDPNPGGHIFPPRDVAGDTATTAPGVGAHVAHLVDNDLTSDIRCSNCHTFPSSFFAEGHISADGLPAQINFGRRAVYNQGINSSYDYTEHTCSNTYCHGNFVTLRDTTAPEFQYIFVDSTGAPSDSLGGNNVTVIWNQVDSTQAQCGSCHGLPPIGHRYQTWPTSCTICHQGVIDAQGNIIDPSKHINGQIDVKY